MWCPFMMFPGSSIGLSDEGPDLVARVPLVLERRCPHSHSEHLERQIHHTLGTERVDRRKLALEAAKKRAEADHVPRPKMWCTWGRKHQYHIAFGEQVAARRGIEPLFPG